MYPCMDFKWWEQLTGTRLGHVSKASQLALAQSCFSFSFIYLTVFTAFAEQKYLEMNLVKAVTENQDILLVYFIIVVTFSGLFTLHDDLLTCTWGFL